MKFLGQIVLPNEPAPASPSSGQIYYDSTAKFPLFYDGTVWAPFDLENRSPPGAFTIPANYSSVLPGPFTLSSGVTMTIQSGGVLMIL